jgi:hypothetical protein
MDEVVLDEKRVINCHYEYLVVAEVMDGLVLGTASTLLAVLQPRVEKNEADLVAAIFCFAISISAKILASSWLEPSPSPESGRDFFFVRVRVRVPKNIINVTVIDCCHARQRC